LNERRISENNTLAHVVINMRGKPLSSQKPVWRKLVWPVAILFAAGVLGQNVPMAALIDSNAAPTGLSAPAPARLAAPVPTALPPPAAPVVPPAALPAAMALTPPAAPAGINSATDSGGAAAPRRLQPNDVLDVSVYQEPDLTAHTSVDAQGMVMLPLVGAVKLGGLTLDDATKKVRDLYDKDYLVNPKVTIQLFKMAVLRFTILGQVKTPGTYDFPPNEKLNLLDGIAMAGGYTRLAQPSKVTVQRNVDGQLKIFDWDAEAMAKDPLHTPFTILPGDTITVSERVF
jgi:polysaccharide export outer membrane protein